MSYNYFLSHKYKFSFFIYVFYFLGLFRQKQGLLSKKARAKKCRLQQAEAKKGKGS
jgi:hypothetical protein